MLELLSRKGEVYNHEGVSFGWQGVKPHAFTLLPQIFVSLDFILFYILYYIICLGTYYTLVLL